MLRVVAHPFNSRALKAEGGGSLGVRGQTCYTASSRPVTEAQQSLATNKTKQNKKLKKAIIIIIIK